VGQAPRRRTARNISACTIRRERDSYRGREHIAAAAVTHARVLRDGRGRAADHVLETPAPAPAPGRSSSISVSTAQTMSTPPPRAPAWTSSKRSAATPTSASTTATPVPNLNNAAANSCACGYGDEQGHRWVPFSDSRRPARR
jgi:hypothetical protein